jgi:hypothetical protein
MEGRPLSPGLELVNAGGGGPCDAVVWVEEVALVPDPEDEPVEEGLLVAVGLLLSDDLLLPDG